jgi:hypothetical protein
MPLPEKIANAPDLKQGLGFFMIAWWDLHYDRPSGFDVGPIASSSIRQFILDCGIDIHSEDAEDIRYVIRRMDREFLAWLKSKRESERIQGKGG